MKFLILTVILVGWESAIGTELVPERYLRPRDFNHHPFTDVGEGPVGKQAYEQDVHPYAVLAAKRPREGRQFPEQHGVVYPNPPEEVLPRKHAEQLQYHMQPSPLPPAKLQADVYQADPADPYDLIAKNYAFSYSVKDKHSGDDFSHSQAHNGDATRGQYRVKLPDGRVQVVSYTADDKGYRADVTYEGAAAAQHVGYQPSYIGHSTPAPHHYDQSTLSPLHYDHSTPAPHIYAHSTPSPQIYDNGGHSTPSPFYVHTSPQQYIDIHNQQRDHPYSNGHFVQQGYPATPSPYHQAYSPTPGSFQQNHSPQLPPQNLFSPTPTPYAEYNQQFEGPTEYRQLAQYEPQYATPAPPSHRFAGVTPTPNPENNFASPSPITFPTSAPERAPERQGFRSQTYPTSSPGLQAYASPSPTPYEATGYASVTPTGYESSGPEFEARYVSATPSPFAIHQSVRSTPAPFARHHNYVTSTEGSPLGHILVTPRTQRSSNPEKSASRRSYGEREHVIYRFKSS